jgi:HEAT repeat protein
MWYLAAEEVRHLGDHCVIPLTRYIQSDRSKTNDSERMKRREAARIVGDVATTWAIPELINLLADEDGDVRYPAARALQRLTGQNLGRPPEQWRDQPLMTCAPTLTQWHAWWQKNQSNYPGVNPQALQPTEIVKEKLLPRQKG